MTSATRNYRQTSYFNFYGGLDLETPALSIDDGALIGCKNYECDIQGGYRRIDGYERFDGKALPSEATYHTVTFENGEHEPQVGETVHGATSNAYGFVLGVDVDSGDWSTSDAVGTLYIYISNGAYVDGENLDIYTTESFSSGFSSGFA